VGLAPAEPRHCVAAPTNSADMLQVSPWQVPCQTTCPSIYCMSRRLNPAGPTASEVPNANSPATVTPGRLKLSSGGPDRLDQGRWRRWKPIGVTAGRRRELVDVFSQQIVRRIPVVTGPPPKTYRFAQERPCDPSRVALPSQSIEPQCENRCSVDPMVPLGGRHSWLTANKSAGFPSVRPGDLSPR